MEVIMKYIISLFLALGATLSHAANACDYGGCRQDEKMIENILPGLTCEQFTQNGIDITICKDAKYGCEYFKTYGGGYGGGTQVAFTLREGSCKEKQIPVVTDKKSK